MDEIQHFKHSNICYATPTLKEFIFSKIMKMLFSVDLLNKYFMQFE